MKRPEPLASYQWPPSNEVIAEKVGLDPRSIIRFDGNVAATPPPSARPAALARALADVNEYDRGRYLSLRSAIADRPRRGLEQVALGAGSDEFIVLLARLFAEGGTVATVPAFSYSMYPFAATMAGATIVDDPATADLVFVCRPNNPTGELPGSPTSRANWSLTRPTPTTPALTPSIDWTAAPSCCARSPRRTDSPAPAWGTRSRIQS